MGGSGAGERACGEYGWLTGFLESGETQTAAELTKCIAIASANDAAVAMAEFVEAVRRPLWSG